MPHLKLSQQAVDRLRPPPATNGDGKAVTHWDTVLRGFAVRVSPQGRKTYLAQYRVRGGKEVVETFGTADKITLAEAQQQAKVSFMLAREGVHPVEQRKQKLAGVQASAAAQAFTFEKMAQRYMREYVDRNCRPSTAKQARRLLRRAAETPAGHLGPGQSFGELPASTITRHDIDAVMEAAYAGRAARARAAPTDGLVEANRLLGYLSRCFKWARQKRLIDADPTLDMAKPLNKEPERDRFLSDDEIVAFWSGCERIGWPFGPLFKLLLLTGQRLSEVAELSWAEVDLDARNWKLPKERAKNKKAHEIALNDLAVAILKGLPRFVGNGFVFAAASGSGPVVSTAHAKKQVVEHMGVYDWRLHDLRRTMVTGMCALGVDALVADKILNHKTGTISSVGLIYNRFEFLPERRAALDLWGEHVAALVGANVVALPGALAAPGRA